MDLANIPEGPPLKRQDPLLETPLPLHVRDKTPVMRRSTSPTSPPLVPSFPGYNSITSARDPDASACLTSRELSLGSLPTPGTATDLSKISGRNVLPLRSNTSTSTVISSCIDSDVTVHIPEDEDLPVGHGTSAVAWNKCANVLMKHDQISVETWKGQIDNLLVYAGLFSAAQIAFTIESYKWLQEDPTSTLVTLQAQILAQLSNSTFDASSIQGGSTFTKSASSIRINTLWFSGVVFSLTAALIGILVKQWLSDYLSPFTSISLLSSRETARIRQFRYQGLLDWRIPEIIAFLPVLLQLATACFLIGLVDFLWTLDTFIALIVSVFVAASIMFLVVTTVLPTLRGDSPHRSPQALAVYRMVQWVRRTFASLIVKISTVRGPFKACRVASWAKQVVEGRCPRTWNERERVLVKASGDRLDHQVVSGADATQMDHAFLEDVVRACINDMAPHTALGCLGNILTHRAHGFARKKSGPHQHKSSKSVATDASQVILIHMVGDVAARVGVEDGAEAKKVVEMLEALCRDLPFGEVEELEGVYRRVIESLGRLFGCGSVGHQVAFSLMRKLYDRLVVSVDASVLEHLILYTRRAQAEDNIKTFYSACEMAIGFSTKCLPTFIRPQLRHMLHNLEAHFRAPTTTLTYPLPDPSLLNTLLDLADKEEIVPRGLVDVLAAIVESPQQKLSRPLQQRKRQIHETQSSLGDSEKKADSQQESTPSFGGPFQQENPLQILLHSGGSKDLIQHQETSTFERLQSQPQIHQQLLPGDTQNLPGSSEGVDRLQPVLSPKQISRIQLQKYLDIQHPGHRSGDTLRDVSLQETPPHGAHPIRQHFRATVGGQSGGRRQVRKREVPGFLGLTNMHVSGVGLDSAEGEHDTQRYHDSTPSTGYRMSSCNNY